MSIKILHNNELLEFSDDKSGHRRLIARTKLINPTLYLSSDTTRVH